MNRPIVVVENFRAMFYAPFYLAQTTGAYADAGVTVDLQSSPSPDHSHARLDAGTADVMWGGPYRVLKQHDADPCCDIRVFHAVVARDPFFIVGRGPNPSFALKDLLALRFASVAEVPTPWICLQQDLRLAGLDPGAIDRRADASMADNAESLKSGDLDAVQLFQPYAEQLLTDGAFHIWSAAASRGPTSYTSLISRRHTLANRRAELTAMARAMAKTLAWIAVTPGEAIAPFLAEHFPAIDPALLAACIDRYKGLGLWTDDTAILSRGFDWLKAAMLACRSIRTAASFETCCDLL